MGMAEIKIVRFQSGKRFLIPHIVVLQDSPFILYHGTFKTCDYAVSMFVTLCCHQVVHWRLVLPDYTCHCDNDGLLHRKEPVVKCANL